MKNVYCINTEQHGGIISGVLQCNPKTQLAYRANSTISQATCAGALSCWKV